MELEGLEQWFCSSSLWRISTQLAVIPWIIHFARTELPSEADVLEVGAGGGFNAKALLNRFPDWRLTAADDDGGMVELARARLSPFGSGVRLERANRSSQVRRPFLRLGGRHRRPSPCGSVGERTGRDGQGAPAGPRASGRRPSRWVLRRSTSAVVPPVRTYGLEELVSALPGAGFKRYRVRGRRLWYRMLAQAAPPS